MTVKELKDELDYFPNDMEVVIIREECEDYEEHYDTDLELGTNDDNQLVIN